MSKKVTDMKNNMLFSIILLICIACGESNSHEKESGLTTPVQPLKNELIKKNFKIVVLDECQYIVYKEQEGSLRGYMAHKGNCNNFIHYYITVTDSIK